MTLETKPHEMQYRIEWCSIKGTDVMRDEFIVPKMDEESFVGFYQAIKGLPIHYTDKDRSLHIWVIASQ